VCKFMVRLAYPGLRQWFFDVVLAFRQLDGQLCFGGIQGLAQRNEFLHSSAIFGLIGRPFLR